jgi:hypothetical protein
MSGDTTATARGVESLAIDQSRDGDVGENG